MNEQNNLEREMALSISDPRTLAKSFLVGQNTRKKRIRLGGLCFLTEPGERCLFKAVRKGCNTAREARDSANFSIYVPLLELPILVAHVRYASGKVH